MIRVVMFDLGDTLVNSAGPFPGVIDALTELRRVKLADGTRPTMVLVSDYVEITPPVTKAKVAAARREYGALLGRMQLRTFFRPMTTKVTLSSDLGIRKPDRRIYQAALARSGTSATFDQCLVITENAAHISACRQLGMSTLQFGVDFTNWSDAVALITTRLGPAVTVIDAQPKAARRTPPRPTATPAAKQRVSAKAKAAQASAAKEAATFERSLRAHGQVSETEELTPGSTHVVEPGSEQPVRRRYSAI
jgi:FMN phosphatase YigB (HAD superfamily)